MRQTRAGTDPAARPRTPATAPARAVRRRWSVLGHVETTAPAAALLRALRTLRPQWTLRVRREPAAAQPRYRVEIAADEPLPRSAAVAPWLRVKSALIAAFPAGRPHALRALD